jgi:predicted RND superfamily exporter protein
LPAKARDAKLVAFQRAWRADLFGQLQTLQAASDPEPVTIDDLPGSLVERLHGHSGAWQLQIFPKKESWDLEPLAGFVQALRTVDPHVTGEPVTALHGVVEMVDSYRTTAIWAGVVIFIACWIDLKRLGTTLLAMVPLTMGCIATFGLMALFGIAFNPANLIALPLILGIGVDFGVHVLHDYEHSHGRYYLSWQFARALILTTTTTVIGFASLLISGHWGMVSIGIVLTLGVATCSGLALVFLPALLALLPERKPVVVDEPIILAFPTNAAAGIRRAA